MQEGVNKREHHLVRLANTRKVKIVKGVTGNLSQEGRNQTPMKTISISPGHVRKEILSHCESGILVFQKLGCPAMCGDPEDHLKLFQSAAKTEGWAMPTWCHMFNSTLIENARVWFDKLPKESIDSYEDLRTSFRENYLQQTKHIKDPVEIHHIKQRSGMHENLRVYARNNPPWANQASI
ncbi:reverse transcriptase domain-containing protein [Tanacetum coccineum]